MLNELMHLLACKRVLSSNDCHGTIGAGLCWPGRKHNVEVGADHSYEVDFARLRLVTPVPQPLTRVRGLPTIFFSFKDKKEIISIFIISFQHKIKFHGFP